MAKKETPAEMSVESKLSTLYKLQTVLSEIDKIRTLRGELPLEVQDLSDEIEGLMHRSEKFNEDINNLTEEITRRQEEIEKATAIQNRYKGQLDEVKNNREYDILTKEIEYQGLEVELQNKKIREAQKQIDTRKEELNGILNRLDIRRTDLDAKKAELDSIVSETKVEEERLRDEAEKLEIAVEPRLLTAFKRIRKNSRNGLGIVYLERDACGGCFNKIPPQRQLDIRMRKKVIVCEFCGRIMIDAELAGVEVVKAETPTTKRRRSAKA